ncbi:MAG TPA: dTMP kinase [Candidatus Dormibacteraeota bacterium]
MAGLFLTFEGPEGSGKSTQIELLRQALAAHEPVVVREPGGTDLGERLRDLVLHDRAMSPAAEMYLFMAARAELLAERILPALAAGKLVIADRYHDSTLAYQGGGRGLVAEWPRFFPKPNRTYLMSMPPELALRRLTGADRIEGEPLDFHRAVAAAYERLAATEPARFVVLDAVAPAEEIHRRVLDDARALLGRLPVSS